jgi:nitroimidazol reductase NimA-like FMN-containing flavoprotein (pyridoxamine 5'-phosphate oxidase superfamily)
MTTWDDACAAAPDLTDAVKARFEATGLGFLATLRADGSPRIGGIEPSFWNGELWLGMMWESRKALDLRRDPRLCVHAASVDKQVEAGDARISGRAVEVEEDATKRALGKALADRTEFDPNDHGPWHLFKVAVEEVYFLRPAGDHLVIEWWTPQGGVQRVDRY